jgi:glycosyltransferase involved in cell wall biosynthesis
MKPRIGHRIRVAVLGVRGIPNVQGGVETHAEQLYQRLTALGCDVEVIVRSPYVPRGQTTFGAIRLRRLWSPRTSGLEALVHSLLGVLYAACSRPDILHVHAVGPSIVTPLARLLGLRVVVTHHGPDYNRDKWGPLARWILRVGERFGMRYANECIAISGVIVEDVRRNFGRVAVQIPNGVTIAPKLSATDVVSRLGLVPGRYFLQVSRMVPEKRQLDLIDAFARARPAGWQLALVGGLDATDYSARVRTAAAQPGVHLTGFMGGTDLQQIYSHAGAFVLPSTHEGLPIALLEALSYGLRTVASDIPANLEVDLGAANYFPVGNVDALAATLRAVAASQEEEGASAARIRRVREHYSWDDVAERTMTVYRSVLGQ